MNVIKVRFDSKKSFSNGNDLFRPTTKVYLSKKEKKILYLIDWTENFIVGNAFWFLFNICSYILCTSCRKNRCPHAHLHRHTHTHTGILILRQRHVHTYQCIHWQTYHHPFHIDKCTLTQMPAYIYILIPYKYMFHWCICWGILW